MGRRKKNESSLGRTLVKDRFGQRPNYQAGTHLHSVDLDDGYDWNKLNLQSVTEENTLDEFLATAQLAGTEFQAEKLNVTVVDQRRDLLTSEERKFVELTQEQHKSLLRIPRRPAWDKTMSSEELDQRERESFLEWRRDLAKLQEIEGLTLTPFERNLEFWRQLWRVLERSDIVVQIVDARNPLLFRCEDLEIYVKEIDDKKMNMLLINKADLLNENQRKFWASYFDTIGVKVCFFSAIAELEEDMTVVTEAENTDSNSLNSAHILSRQELLDYIRSLKLTSEADITTVGLVGYPNVGKSSSINTLLQTKKVQVSATPGRTKHFQTLFVEKDILLCDCPGLVMPTFVSTKADMILNGILPIDQMRDFQPSVTQLCEYIPRSILEAAYGFLLPEPCTEKGESADTPPTAHQLLTAHACVRGYMTHKGVPDFHRSARVLLKDFVKGKLLYCMPPPGVSGEEYGSVGAVNKPVKKHVIMTKNIDKPTPVEIQESISTGFHVVSERYDSSRLEGKSWKKHGNRNKKEKLRHKYKEK